jgi:hypothetical protein
MPSRLALKPRAQTLGFVPLKVFPSQAFLERHRLGRFCCQSWLANGKSCYLVVYISGIFHAFFSLSHAHFLFSLLPCLSNLSHFCTRIIHEGILCTLGIPGFCVCAPLVDRGFTSPHRGPPPLADIACLSRDSILLSLSGTSRSSLNLRRVGGSYSYRRKAYIIMGDKRTSPRASPKGSPKGSPRIQDKPDDVNDPGMVAQSRDLKGG